MIKSTAASAGPVESVASSPSAYYLWEFPQKPVSVRLSLDVVDRLERDVLESFRAITARGSEVGGLLLGRTESDGSLRTIVENYELFHCDYTRGPLYLLSDEEKARLEDSIRRKKAGPGQAGVVVGFFRSHTRKDLALDDEDLEMFRKSFSRPEQIFMLVKPYAARAGVAGIFIWESAKVRSEGSYIEFPFRRAELMKGEFSKSIVTDKTRPKETPIEPLAPLPNAPKAATRAPVLPFSLKRDEGPPVAAPPLKREDRAPVVTMSPKPKEAEAPPAAARKVVELPAERKTPVETPAARKLEKPAPIAPLREDNKEEKKESPAAKLTAPAARPAVKLAARIYKEEVPAPAAWAEPLPARFSFGGKKLWALFGGLIMLGLAVGSLSYLYTHSATPMAAVARDTGSLDLKAERSNGQLLVTWNRDAASIRTAQRAVLSISDGAQKEDVPLDLSQLRGGSIVYSPDPKGTGEVSFRLDVTDANSGRTKSESVQATATPVEAAPGQPPAADTSGKPSPQKGPATEAAGIASETQPITTGAPDLQQAPQQPATPPKAFSLAARVHAPEANDLPDAPTVVSGAGGTARPIVPATAGQLAPPPAPKPAPAPVQAQPATPTPAQPASKVGGKVQEPQLLRKVEPVYPPMARQARVGGVVRMQATIGKDGKIRKVEVLSGPPLLRQAAVDAVQKWVYSPSLLNGAPIDVNTDVELSFSLTSH